MGVHLLLLFSPLNSIHATHSWGLYMDKINVYFVIGLTGVHIHSSNTYSGVTNECGITTDIHTAIGHCIDPSSTIPSQITNEGCVPTDVDTTIGDCTDSSTICSWGANEGGIPTSVHIATDICMYTTTMVSWVSNKNGALTDVHSAIGVTQLGLVEELVHGLMH